MENAGFNLRLSDEQVWHITAHTSTLQPWLNRAAAIMELDAGVADVASRKIICVNIDEESEINPECLDHEAREGNWSYHPLRTMTAWFRRGSDESVCVFDIADNQEADIIAIGDLLYPVYRQVMRHKGLSFHAGLIEHNGKGILLAAPGGTGKSTCCRRIPESWTALCDDESLIVSGDDGNYYVHPFPTWSDYLLRRSEKTWNVQRAVPLHAVFFIHQAQEEVAVPVRQGEAAVMIYAASMQIWQKYLRISGDEINREYRTRIFENACHLAPHIPVFRLGVSINGRYWEEIERVLGW